MTSSLELQMCRSWIIFLSFALVSGCSTKQARLQDLSIATDPPGVRATIDDRSCITPCTLTNVDRAAEDVMFEQGAYRQQYILDKKYNNGAMATVEFIGLKITVPAFVITGAAYEILPIDVKFSGSAENRLKNASPVVCTSGLREVAPEPDSEKEQISSTEPVEHPFALTAGVSSFFYDSDTRTLTGLLGFEKMLGGQVSWYLDAGYADYRSAYGNYRDTAHGLGAETGMNVYPYGQALKGLYFGGGLGSWVFKGGWKDDAGTPFETTGRGKARVVDINVHLGYKWAFAGSQGFFIDPSIALDFMSTDCEPYPYGPAGASVKAGLAIGKRW